MRKQNPSMLRKLPEYRRHRRVIILSITMLMLFSNNIFAQKAAWNWYFGNGAGLTFKNGVAESVSDGKVVTNEGCAAISDTATGELLFYTDGVTVWNNNHEVMLNGTGLNGDISTSQSAVIVPWIGNPSVFFIFNPAPVTSANLVGRCFCLYYSVVDLRKDNGRGEVVLKNLQIATDITEHITATLDCRNEGWWIVARSRASNSYYSFHLTADRLEQPPVVSVANPNLTLDVRDAGQMHISPDGQKMVVTSAAGNSQILDFDPITGVVSNAYSLFPAPKYGAHYGAAFSQNSKSVFIAVANEGTAVGQSIYSFNLQQPVNSLVPDTKKLVGEMISNFSWTPMQLGPDGNIYVGTPNMNSLGIITNANTFGQEQFVESAITLSGTCNSGLPNFPGSTLRIVSPQDLACTAPEAFIVNTVACQGKCKRFDDASIGFIDKWFWTFQGGTPSVSEDKNPTCIVYNTPGVYPIRLIVYNKYGPDTAFASVTVLEKPVITASGSTTICNGKSTALSAQGGVTYAWTPAASLSNANSATPRASPLTTTTYTVVGTGPTGCTDTAKVTVSVAKMSASGATSICFGASTQLKAEGGTEYFWSPVTGLNNPNIATPISTPTATTKYVVRITNADCEVFDTVLVTVVDNIRPTIQGVTSACDGDTITLQAVGGGQFHTWFGIGILDTNLAETRVVVNGNSTYKVVTTSGSCRDSATWDVAGYKQYAVTATNDTSVFKGQTVRLSATTQADSVVWTPSEGLNVSFGKSVTASPTRTVTYFITAVSQGGCESYDSVTVTVKSSEFVNGGPDKNICAGEGVMLEGSTSASSVSWFPADDLSNSTIANPVASPSKTTIYTVSVGSGECLSVDTVVVYVSSVDLQLSADTTVCPGDPIRLLALGATKYLWSPSTGLSDPTIHNPIATPTISTRYFVTGTDQYGCTSTGSVNVFVKNSVEFKVKAGVVQTEVGNQEVGIPLIVQTNSNALPIFIDSLSARLVIAADAFFPTSVDRGDFIPTLRDSFRVAHIKIRNIAIISPEQKITEIRGTVLLGNTDATEIRWENLEWTGDATCPISKTENGLLIVTGCNIKFRRLRQFENASLTISTQPLSNKIELIVSGSEAGRYMASVYSIDGRQWYTSSFVKPAGDAAEVILDVDMQAISTGSYIVVLHTPFSVQSEQIIWIRQ